MTSTEIGQRMKMKNTFCSLSLIRNLSLKKINSEHDR